jgi:hypothetical protein
LLDFSGNLIWFHREILLPSAVFESLPSSKANCRLPSKAKSTQKPQYKNEPLKREKTTPSNKNQSSASSIERGASRQRLDLRYITLGAKEKERVLRPRLDNPT